jgi:hypothetical protein
MPISTSAQDINTELGVSSTASVNLNATAVRNLAVKSSGAISFADCRWGIAVPARNVDVFVGTASPAYSSTNSANISSSITVSDEPPIARAHCKVSFNSNGTLTYEAYNSLGFLIQNQESFNYTWLIVGSNSDYTIRLDLTSGSLIVGSSATGSDLALTSSRSWEMLTGDGSASAAGTLTLKRSGTAVIARPISMQADVIVLNP